MDEKVDDRKKDRQMDKRTGVGLTWMKADDKMDDKGYVGG